MPATEKREESAHICWPLLAMCVDGSGELRNMAILYIYGPHLDSPPRLDIAVFLS